MAKTAWLVTGLIMLTLSSGGIGFGLGRATGPDLLRDTEPTAVATSTSTPTSTSPDVFTVMGSMTVNGTCGSGGYSDITLGGQVEIVNQDNEVLGVGSLASGTGALCSFTFTVSGIPEGERLYGAKIGNANRGVIWKSESDTKYQGFHLTLG